MNLKQTHMKSMLWVGATLMIGASVYGLADYRQTRNKPAFQNMYASEKSDNPQKQVGRSEIPSDQKEKTQEEPMVNKTTAPDKNNSIEPEKKKEPTRAVKKKRKVRREFFSRAPLRDEEEYTEADMKKQTNPKTEKKEL
jgi:hypothetical protein